MMARGDQLFIGAVDQAKAEKKAELLAEFVEPVKRPSGEWTGRFKVESRTQAGTVYTVSTYGYRLDRWHAWGCQCEWYARNGGRDLPPGERAGYWACAHVRAARIFWTRRAANRAEIERAEQLRADWREQQAAARAKLQDGLQANDWRRRPLDNDREERI